MEAFLRVVLPRILGATQFEIRPFQNKDQLLKHLPSRLQGYAKWIPEDYRIVVLADRDSEDCEQLKAQLEQMALDAGLATRSQPAGGQFTVINRIVIEKLEAWYFGDLDAVEKAFPSFKANKYKYKSRFKNPDAINKPGDELKRLVRGFSKSIAAREIPKHMSIEQNTSTSFNHLISGLLNLVKEQLSAHRG